MMSKINTLISGGGVGSLYTRVSQVTQWYKEPVCQCRRCEFSPWVRKIPWRRKWQCTPVSLPGKSHGQRSLAGYSPWDCERVRYDIATKQKIEGFLVLKKYVLIMLEISNMSHFITINFLSALFRRGVEREYFSKCSENRYERKNKI